MILKSKFKLLSFIMFFLFALITLLLFVIVKAIAIKQSATHFGVFVFLLFLGVIWTWVVFVEFRTRAFKIRIEENVIYASSFFGIWPKKAFCFSNLEGYITVTLPTKYESYEYLFLIVAGRRKISVSEYYHKNYFELKSAIADRSVSLGHLKFKVLNELKAGFQ